MVQPDLRQDRRFHRTQKALGQVVLTVTTAVSTDGKTRISTFKSKDTHGDINNVVVYKQLSQP